jgi:hypothetical protein
MRSRRWKSLSSIAAWLGILALGIQSLIPVLLATEIEIASTQPGKSVFTLCDFGHIHLLPDRGADSKSPTPAGDDGQGTVCPICVALQASPPFTSPAPIILPLPSARPLVALVASARPAAELTATAAYRSRAPPLG